MLDLILSVLTGGATGLIGTIVGGIFDWLNAGREAKERQADRAHELALQRLQMERGDRETENELQIIQAQTDQAQLTASYRHDMAAGQGSQWVINVLRLVRPTLTFGLIVTTAWMWATMEVDTTIDGQGLKAYIVHSTVYTASAAVLWWFGDRARRLQR